jgi:hypothetical protein
MVEKAEAGDFVYVAVGTYYGGFIMKEGVTVMGGYTANKDNPTERYNTMETDDPAKQSILDGGGTQRVLTQYAPFSIPTTWNGFVLQNGNPSVEFKKGSVIYSNNGNNQIIGILYKYDPETKQGMMIGTEEVKKQWGGYEKEIPGLPIVANRESAKNDLSGQAHSEAIINALGNQCPDFSEESYPLNGNYAAYWSDTLTTGGYSDWFLPSPGELQEVHDANLNPLMKSLGKNTNYPYWTGSHVGNTLAWAYCFGNGYFHPALKYVHYQVNAIHPFTVPEQPDGIYFAGGGAFICANGILENCIVKDNVSSSKGGGVYVGKGGKLINCRVEGNDAPEGKEIYYEELTAIHSLKEDSGFRIYPNPAKAGEKINIECNLKSNANYQWVNTSGTTVKKGRLNPGENGIATPEQPGIFILSIQSETVNYKTKLIINN